jgi:antitoxin (DNA-binding transcriptional repressor) of toxin-antitoxin stability system
MAIQVNIEDAAAQFSTLLQHIRAGEPVHILENGHELARLVPSPTLAANLPLPQPLTLAETLKDHLGTLDLNIPAHLREDPGEILTDIAVEKHQALNP